MNVVLFQAVRELDRCGANFHYQVVLVQADDSTNATLDDTQNINRSVVDASATSVDVALSDLPWLTGGTSSSMLQLGVRAVNSQGPATGPLKSVTVTSKPRTCLTALYTCVEKTNNN